MLLEITSINTLPKLAFLNHTYFLTTFIIFNCFIFHSRGITEWHSNYHQCFLFFLLLLKITINVWHICFCLFEELMFSLKGPEQCSGGSSALCSGPRPDVLILTGEGFCGTRGCGQLESVTLRPFLFPRHWHSLLKGPEPTKRATRAFFPGPSSWGQIMPPLQTSLGLGGGQGTLRAETVCSGRLGCLQLCARLFYRMTLGCKENGAGIEPQVAGGR